MGNQQLLVLMIVFLVFSLSVLWIGKWSIRRMSSPEKRLEKFFSKPQIEDDNHRSPETEGRSGLKELLRKLVHTVGKGFTGKSFVQKWDVRIEQAALPLKAEEFFALRLLLGGAIGFFVFLLGYTGTVILPAVLAGYLLPRIYLQRRKNKRLARCSTQLVNALGTMSTAMKAGFSFMQAMQLIGREVPDPLGPEFERTIREINFGVPLEEAFQRLLERLPDGDLELMVTAVMIQRTTGGNLSEILESIQETIRERVRIKEELRTLTAQGRMSAWVISLLPVILGFILNFLNAEYFAPMLREPLGWALLGMAAVSGIIGWIAIQKIVRIEV